MNHTPHHHTPPPPPQCHSVCSWRSATRNYKKLRAIKCKIREGSNFGRLTVLYYVWPWGSCVVASCAKQSWWGGPVREREKRPNSSSTPECTVYYMRWLHKDVWHTVLIEVWRHHDPRVYHGFVWNYFVEHYYLLKILFHIIMNRYTTVYSISNVVYICMFRTKEYDIQLLL